ncbi:Putative aliphatic sulfonates-binding protein precursor [Lacunisphaera limnophila]|uniref:Aliphatic sulfonates-binding protein n=1 Tax=Lacunisphaera limnophila TaxID=1838286 RepID=A0A1I7PHH7_9BACT|nr:ABC transporter substrate-binding protein [Lacunisphaera limnophila]AOS43059.1 Putative aliphatic sulfonates-binding protein precursor [Lacunisphaera limnophila]
MKPIFLLLLLVLGVGLARAEKVTLRVGYFPNITHAQGVIGSHSTREKQGWFEQRLGPDVVIQWYAFNAGPSAMEAIFAGSIDLTYVGPNPALNAFIRSQGEEIRVLAGATLGGAALVVPGDGRITAVNQFKGRRVATPQLGNTQDVAARAWFKQHGFKVTMTGGDVLVLPTPNPEQLSLFQQGKFDAVWTVEPWVSRLELEAGGRVFLEQTDAVTTVLVSSVKFLRTHPDLVNKFKAAHQELTVWLNEHPAEARAKVRAGLSAEMKREMSEAIVTSAWRRLQFSDQVTQKQFEVLVTEAQGVGFLRNAIPLDRLFSGQP